MNISKLGFFPLVVLPDSSLFHLMNHSVLFFLKLSYIAVFQMERWGNKCFNLKKLKVQKN